MITANIVAANPTGHEATKLADLANEFANNGRGRLRMELDQAAVRDP